MDRRPEDAGGHRHGRSDNRPFGRLEGRCRGAATAARRRPPRRASRFDGPGNHDRTFTPERRGRGERKSERCRGTDEHRNHVRVVPLDCRQLVDDRDRKATRWLGEHDPQRRCHRRTLAGAGRCDQGGVHDVGPRQVRSEAPRVRRHQPAAAEQPIAADCHPADLRTERRRLRDGQRRRTDFVPGTVTLASARWAARAASAIRASV